MELIRVEDIWKHVPARWRAVYKGSPYLDKVAITTALSALLPIELTGERIEAIIGNTSWTRIECDECGLEKKALMRLGEDHVVDICADCLREALVQVETLPTPENTND